MRIPVIQGVIDRRILANFRVDPAVMRGHLPAPFRPKVVNGSAIGGICLIRLTNLRPKHFPFPCGTGFRSENAAHRIAVEWDDEGQVREGVYIPRRDTDSRIMSAAGGSLFPGIHHLATFTVDEKDDHYSVMAESMDGKMRVRTSGRIAKGLPSSSVFSSVSEASDFFERGSLGYSATEKSGRFDGLELCCDTWNVEPLAMETVDSSYFEDESQFPKGSVEFDCALLMRGIEHEWKAREDLCCSFGTTQSVK